MTYTHDARPEAPPRMAGEGLDMVASAFSEAAGRSSAVFNAGLRLWEAETARFVEELAAQSQMTFGRLCECKTPLDVLSVEQEWLRARSRFYLESGLRFADAFAAVARETGDEGAEAAPAPAPARPHKTHA